MRWSIVASALADAFLRLFQSIMVPYWQHRSSIWMRLESSLELSAAPRLSDSVPENLLLMTWLNLLRCVVKPTTD